MARDYRELAGDIVPTVLQGHFGKRFRDGISLLLDSLVEGSRFALTDMWLRRNLPVPEDGLIALASERNIDRYPPETSAPWILRARVDLAWQTWQGAGGPKALLDQLTAAGWPNAQIFYQWSSGLPVVSPPDHWSQFWLFFPFGSHPVTANSKTWGIDFDYGDGTLYGVQGLTLADIQLLRSIIRKWKPGNYICRHILFELSSGGAASPPYDVASMSA